MSAAFQIVGFALGVIGAAMFVYVFAGLVCALSIGLVGVGILLWIIGQALERSEVHDAVQSP